MKETANYKIKYPEPSDFVNTETFKDAFTTIDVEIKRAAGQEQTLQITIPRPKRMQR